MLCTHRACGLPVPRIAYLEANSRRRRQAAGRILYRILGTHPAGPVPSLFTWLSSRFGHGGHSPLSTPGGSMQTAETSLIRGLGRYE